MKLLIFTQAVDSADPVLGFFHRWLEALAPEFERVEVVCLKEGKHALPKNVRVHSLGKEKGRPRAAYLFNFYRYLFLLSYDAVFVHMNEEYVLLGGWYWRLFGKKIFLWRNHAKGSLRTRIAILFSNKVFCTSPESFTAQFAKTQRMPVGIDTDFFKPDESVPRKPNSILFLGRIAPVKNVDIFVAALEVLHKQGVPFSATIAGSALHTDKQYEARLRQQVKEGGLDGVVTFTGPVAQEEALRLYREHALYVNLTPSGSMDKTIFEALAAGIEVLVANRGLVGVLGAHNVIDAPSPDEVAKRIEVLLNAPAKSMRGIVVREHSLEQLVAQLRRELA